MGRRQLKQPLFLNVRIEDNIFHADETILGLTLGLTFDDVDRVLAQVTATIRSNIDIYLQTIRTWERDS